MKNIARFCLIFSCIFGFEKGVSEEEPCYMDYESGNVTDKIYIDHKGAFTVLYINEISSIEAFPCLIEKILMINADIVCLSMSITAEFTSAFYAELKNRYAHFYQNNSFLFESNPFQGNLLIASNFELGEFSFSYSSMQNELKKSSGVFSFIIKQDQENLGNIYIVDTDLAGSLHLALKKLEGHNIFSPLESVSFIQSEEASSDYIIETVSTYIENIGNCFLTTVFQYKEFTSGLQNCDNYDLLCKDNTNNSSNGNDSSGHYNFSTKQDFEKNTTSVQGSIGYKLDAGRNSNISVDVSGELRKNSHGNPTGQIEASVSGNF